MPTLPDPVRDVFLKAEYGRSSRKLDSANIDRPYQDSSCNPGLRIVGYVTDSGGTHPEVAKLIKIINWPEPMDATGARAFIGICVYYKIWIEGFAILAEPIYRLLKKDVVGRRTWEAAHEKVVRGRSKARHQFQ